MLKLRVPVLLIQKGTGILKVLGSGSFRKSWVLLDYKVHAKVFTYKKVIQDWVAFMSQQLLHAKAIAALTQFCDF